jgi:uncharacterized protein YndB with AHSA1/START domain
MTLPTPTGRVEPRDGQQVLVLRRQFRAPIEDVWAAVTESDRLARWIGRWEGDPTTGSVVFQMLFEEGHQGEVMEIRRCEPPRALSLTGHQGADLWHLDLELSQVDGVTTLTFTQPGVTADLAPDVGPGWEYYLDRLVDAETGRDPGGRDFDRDYHPAMSAYYRAQSEPS